MQSKFYRQGFEQAIASLTQTQIRTDSYTATYRDGTEELYTDDGQKLLQVRRKRKRKAK